MPMQRVANLLEAVATALTWVPQVASIIWLVAVMKRRKRQLAVREDIPIIPQRCADCRHALVSDVEHQTGVCDRCWGWRRHDQELARRA